MENVTKLQPYMFEPLHPEGELVSNTRKHQESHQVYDDQRMQNTNW